MANWGANFVVTISFLTLLNAIGGDGVFFLFGFLTLVALVYFWQRGAGDQGPQPAGDRARPARPAAAGRSQRRHVVPGRPGPRRPVS